MCLYSLYLSLMIRNKVLLDQRSNFSYILPYNCYVRYGAICVGDHRSYHEHHPEPPTDTDRTYGDQACQSGIVALYAQSIDTDTKTRQHQDYGSKHNTFPIYMFHSKNIYLVQKQT